MKAVDEAVTSVGNSALLNHSTDSASCEFKWNQEQVYYHLEGKINQLILVDPNQNAKELRYQIIGGFCVGVIGDNLIDI